MNCDETRRHWHLYYDSEGEAELYFQVNDHLAGCPACAEWFHKQSRLEDLIADKLAVGNSATPTPGLWQSVLAKSGLERPAAVRRWFASGWFIALAASLAALIGVWQFAGAPSAVSADLAEVTADYHERFAGGRKPIDFASPSDLEVEKYLQRQVSFPVRCPPRKDTGFRVRGGGVCRSPGCELVYVVGRVENEPVSVFILSREELARFPHQLEAVRRKGRHQWRQGGKEMIMAQIDQNIVLVVGRTDTGRLLRVLNAYGSYHEGHRG